MSEKRTYKGYGKAFKGAMLILDPEEEIAVKHTIYLAALLGIGVGHIGASSEIGKIFAGITIFGSFVYYLFHISEINGGL